VKPNQTSKLNVKSEKLSDLLNKAEVETDAEAEKKEEALEELKRLHEEDDSVKWREAATIVRMLAKENLGLKVLFVYEDVDVEGHIT